MPKVPTDAELEKLREIQRSGVQSVEADGRKVVYRSQADVERALEKAEGDAAAGAGASGPVRRRRFLAFSRGVK